MEKKQIRIDKADYSVENGKIIIESEELAKCIQNEGFELALDESAGAVIHGAAC